MRAERGDPLPERGAGLRTGRAVGLSEQKLKRKKRRREKPVGFYKDEEGKTRPITTSKRQRKTVKHVKRVVKPASAKAKRYRESVPAGWRSIKIPERGRRHIAIFTEKAAEKIYSQTRPHVGEEAILYGGGGSGRCLVKLKAVEIKHPTYYADSVEKVPKGATNVKTIAPGQVTYEPKDDYIVKVTLDGLDSKSSLFQEVAKPAYIDKKGKYHPPKYRQADFKPHLGSWKLAFRTAPRTA